MAKLYFLINTLNGREKAAIAWILILLLWALSKRDTRASILNLLKTIFHKKIITVIIAMFVYVALILLVFSKIFLWNIALTKDIIFWIFGSAMVLLINVNKISRDDHQFKKILKDNLTLIVIIEFLVSLYSFNFWIEMLFVPALFIVVAIGVVATTDVKYLPVKKVINFVLLFIGVFLIIFAIFKVVTNFQDFMTMDNLRSLVLPPLLTLAYIPFLYIFALIIAYEMLFVRLDFFLKNDKSLADFAKKKIFLLCLLNLRKLNKFINMNTASFHQLNHKNDILNLIENFNK